MAPVLLWVLVVLGVLGAWRLYPRRHDPWVGPIRPEWALARRLAWAAKWGLLAGLLAAVPSCGLLLAIGGERLAGAVLSAMAPALPVAMAAHVANAALSGPASSRTPSPPQRGGSPRRGASLRYACHDWFLLVVSPLAWGVLAGLVAVVAAVPGVNSEDIPPVVTWGFGLTFAAGFVVLVRGVVVRASVEEGWVTGRTMLGLRRFRYPRDEIQVSLRRMESPPREFLLVSHLGAWPVLISSAGTGYDGMLESLLGSAGGPSDG